MSTSERIEKLGRKSVRDQQTDDLARLGMFMDCRTIISPPGPMAGSSITVIWVSTMR
jgi:hypothetical protein